MIKRAIVDRIDEMLWAGLPQREIARRLSVSRGFVQLRQKINRRRFPRPPEEKQPREPQYDRDEIQARIAQVRAEKIARGPDRYEFQADALSARDCGRYVIGSLRELLERVPHDGQ